MKMRFILFLAVGLLLSSMACATSCSSENYSATVNANSAGTTNSESESYRLTISPSEASTTTISTGGGGASPTSGLGRTLNYAKPKRVAATNPTTLKQPKKTTTTNKQNTTTTTIKKPETPPATIQSQAPENQTKPQQSGMPTGQFITANQAGNLLTGIILLLGITGLYFYHAIKPR